ncbi:L-type lectin-domain containing receptor kinase VII.1 [Sesamum angolense]|uniref:non-specific serine/threonine protein kinase n=1 Tax=Sesamum angolense TaxID=2727404 RepID=A0AAE2BVF3_9LAMI|nr:L-type lectin-domain containing receptor kinase VII.1 [Sesamum angolense]
MPIHYNSCYPTQFRLDFLFNGFGPSDVSLYGNATIESRILTLTNDTTFSIGRALYPSKIPTKQPNSSLVLPFSTSFIFAMAPYEGRLPGHGIVFLFVPHDGIEGASSAQHLGLFNFTNNGNPNNHVFGVEFDVFKNEEFQDINANHVGVDVNSLNSASADEAGYWPDGYRRKEDGSTDRNSFKKLTLNNGKNYQVWILCRRRNRRIRKEREEMEDWELEYWPHRITYQEIESATKNFSEENVIGIGGNGKVYKGSFPGGSEVAVKRISHENSEGIRAFLAEISSLGRLKHRNLVGLRGWCKKEKGSLILVYDYMENGSLDQRVFECDESKMLSCEDRIRILKQVASGILYLHYGWECKVLHRDIKASNVLLDKEMNARLGDFGLARMHEHDKVAGTTRVVGTVGYLAPEIVKSGKASTQTDVFGYGVLILEVMCGRRPIEEGKPPLVEWVWELLRRGELLNVVDARLRARGDIDTEEVERVLHLGLLCAHPDTNTRPTMRQVVKLFEGNTEVDETEGEDMDMYLLETMKTNEIWSMYPQNFSSGSSSHPTFEEIRRGLSTSMSLSWSNTNIVEGRRFIGQSDSWLSMGPDGNVGVSYSHLWWYMIVGVFKQACRTVHTRRNGQMHTSGQLMVTVMYESSVAVVRQSLWRNA